MMQITQTTEEWRADRLYEARNILADIVHHPDTRLILAARVVIANSRDEAERTEAQRLWRLLEPRRSHDCVASASQQGGGA